MDSGRAAGENADRLQSKILALRVDTAAASGGGGGGGNRGGTPLAGDAAGQSNIPVVGDGKPSASATPLVTAIAQTAGGAAADNQPIEIGGGGGGGGNQVAEARDAAATAASGGSPTPPMTVGGVVVATPKAQALTVQVALLTEEAEAKRLELQRAKDALDHENRSAAARAIELLRKKLASLAEGIGSERSSAQQIRANIQHLKQSQMELFDEEKKRLTLVRRGELEQKVFEITGRRIE